MENKKNTGRIIVWLIVPILLVCAIYLMSGSKPQESPKYAEVISYFDMGTKQFDAMKSFDLSLEEGTVTIEFEKGTKDNEGKDIEKFEYSVPYLELFINDVRERQYELKEYIAETASKEDITEETEKDLEKLRNHPLLTNYDIQPMADTSWLISILPTVLLIGFMFLIWFLFMRRLSNMGDGA